MVHFKDYYAILEVSQEIDDADLRKVYLRLVKKWHPDKNPNLDTTERMQEIVEANLILSDKESREKYDKEYNAYHRHTSGRAFKTTEVQSNKAQPYSYNFEDEVLERWVRNAQKQSVSITQELIKELRLHFTNGLKGAFDGMVNFVTGKKII